MRKNIYSKRACPGSGEYHSPGFPLYVPDLYYLSGHPVEVLFCMEFIKHKSLTLGMLQNAYILANSGISVKYVTKTPDFPGEYF